MKKVPVMKVRIADDIGVWWEFDVPQGSGSMDYFELGSRSPYVMLKDLPKPLKNPVICTQLGDVIEGRIVDDQG